MLAFLAFSHFCECHSPLLLFLPIFFGGLFVIIPLFFLFGDFSRLYADDAGCVFGLMRFLCIHRTYVRGSTHPWENQDGFFFFFPFRPAAAQDTFYFLPLLPPPPQILYLNFIQREGFMTPVCFSSSKDTTSFFLFPMENLHRPLLFSHDALRKGTLGLTTFFPTLLTGGEGGGGFLFRNYLILTGVFFFFFFFFFWWDLGEHHFCFWVRVVCREAWMCELRVPMHVICLLSDWRWRRGSVCVCVRVCMYECEIRAYRLLSVLSTFFNHCQLGSPFSTLKRADHVSCLLLDEAFN